MKMKLNRKLTTRALALLLVPLLLFAPLMALGMLDESPEEPILAVEELAPETEPATALEPFTPEPEEDTNLNPADPDEPTLPNPPKESPDDDDPVIVEVPGDGNDDHSDIEPPEEVEVLSGNTVDFIRTNRLVGWPSAWMNAGSSRYSGFYQIRIGGNLHPVFCLQPRLPGPQSGTYAVTVLNENTLLSRALYYVYGAPGQGYYLDNVLGNIGHLASTSVTGSRDGDAKYVLSHLTLSLIYQGESVFNGLGVNATGRAAARAFRDWIQNAPDPPHARKSFSNANVQATIDLMGGQHITPEITFDADPRNTITLDPRRFGDGVVLHRTRDGATTAHSEDVELRGGDTFHLRAPLDIPPGTRNSGNLHGTNTMHWRAILFNQASTTTQTMSGWSFAYDPVAPIQLSVTWRDVVGGLVVTKTAETGRVENIDFRIQGVEPHNRHVDITITTDHEGNAIAWELPPGLVRVTEINVPAYYRQPSPQYIMVTLDVLYETRLQFHNELIRGRVAGLKVDHTGDPLAGAVIGLFAADKTMFTKYTAIETTVSASDGGFSFEGLRYGEELIVREIKSPVGFILSDETFPVTIRYHEQVIEITIANEPTRVSIRTQAHTGDGSNQYFTHGDVLRMFDDVEITHEGILDGTERAFETFLVARLPNGTVQEVWRSGLIDYVVEDAVFTHRVVTEYVDTGRFPRGTIFTFREVGFNEIGEEDAWHNCDFDDKNQNLYPRPEVPRTGDDTQLPWMQLVMSGLVLVGIVVGLVIWNGRKKRDANQAD